MGKNNRSSSSAPASGSTLMKTKNPGFLLTVPESGRKAFVSHCNDPDHPVNNGKLTSVLTGSLLGTKPGLVERTTMSIREAQESKRAAHGEPSSEPIEEKWARYQRNKRPGLIKKVLQEDVLYLVVANMPSEEELQQAVVSLETYTA